MFKKPQELHLKFNAITTLSLLYLCSEFLKQYQQGFTPNPDILCNKYIKFDKFLNHALSRFGADGLATGHYAQTSVGDRFLFDENATSKGEMFIKSRFELSHNQVLPCLFPVFSFVQYIFRSAVSTLQQMLC